MTDLERAFRDALRRVDAIEVPVPPIDPAGLSGRVGLPWRTLLAAAAALVLIAGVGVAVWLNGRGIPATPVPPAGQAVTTVEVDVFSGRANPVLELDPSVADELYALFDDHSGSAESVEPPELGLGFRGLVVTPADAARPVLRIQPDAVLYGTLEAHQRLSDPDGVFFGTVLDAIRGSLPPEVLQAIGEPAEETPPDDTSPPPADGPEPGDVATWILLEPVTAESTDLVIGVTRLGCANGETGRVLPAVVEYGEDRIVIGVDVESRSDQPADCQGNDEVMFSVQLTEPIGQRDLVDAACLSGEAQGTSFCAAGAVRWTP